MDLDVGTQETNPDETNEFNQLYLNGTVKVNDALLKKVAKEQVLLIVDKAGIHNEKDWSRRFYHAIGFLLS